LVVDIDIDQSYAGTTEFPLDLSVGTHEVTAPAWAWCETYQTNVAACEVWFDGECIDYYCDGLEFDMSLGYHTLTIYYIAGK
jgi:hypothetical protein